MREARRFSSSEYDEIILVSDNSVGSPPIFLLRRIDESRILSLVPVAGETRSFCR